MDIHEENAREEYAAYVNDLAKHIYNVHCKADLNEERWDEDFRVDVAKDMLTQNPLFVVDILLELIEKLLQKGC